MKDCNEQTIEIGDRVLFNPKRENAGRETFTTIGKVMGFSGGNVVLVWGVGSTQHNYRFDYDVKKWIQP